MTAHSTSFLLTDREQAILTLLALDRSDHEIAEQLRIAYTTVKWYNRQIFNKLSVDNRKQAVERARALGILDAEPAVVLETYLPLPAQSSPFVGREAELGEVGALLRDGDVRLLTILAPGGMGKTRLALEAARRHFEQFHCGVYFVPLQAVTAGEQIVPAIIQHLDLHFDADGQTPEQQLTSYLSRRSALLVLDNFEQLLDGTPLLVRLLEACPRLKVLVTAREQLNASIETVYGLHPMPYPTDETASLDCDAVRLLTQSARRLQPDFVVTVENRAQVARVCQLTAGMPLGILLATSWLDTLPLKRIAEEIAKSIDFLETALRDLPERQRTLRAVFESAWTQLQPAEQQVFRRLSVFKGGFTVEAAEAVAVATLQQLQVLVKHALVTRGEADRYYIHELLRQYGAMRLHASGDEEEILDRQRAYYAEFVRIREGDLKGGRQVEGTDEIAADFENIRAAWYQTLAGDPLRIEPFLFPLVLYAVHRTRYREILELLNDAEEQMRPHYAEHRVYGWLITMLGRVLGGFYHDPKAEDLLRRGLAIARREHDEVIIAEATLQLAWCFYARGKRDDDTLQLFNESLHMYERLNDEYGLAWGLVLRGWYLCRTGELETGQNDIQRSLVLHDRIGDLRGVSCCYEFFEVLKFETDFDESEALCRRALAIRRRLGARALIATSLLNLAFCVFRRGDLAGFRQLVLEALSFAEETGAAQPHYYGHIYLALHAIARGDVDDARQHVAEALDSGAFFTSLLQDIVQGLERLCADNYPGAQPFLVKALMKRTPLISDDDPLILMGMGFALARQGTPERGLELVSLALNHPAMPKALADAPLVARQLEAIRTLLPAAVFAEIWERGKTLDLKRVIQDLQDEFRAAALSSNE